jgi:hypothetical protein
VTGSLGLKQVFPGPIRQLEFLAMDKMFYTMPEACQKLAISEDKVREMVSSGQLQEFRDKDELVFKVEQINLLAGVDEDTGDVVIDLSGASAASNSDLELTGGSGMELTGAEQDTSSQPPAAASDLGLSAGLGLTGGSGMDLGDSGSAAGLSAFDTGAGMASDEDAGATRVGGDGMDDDLTLETVGSGSGLMDLTRESDDTSLGAEILDDAWNSDEEEFDELANASGLFEAASPDETALSGAVSPRAPKPVMAGAPMAMFQESYDGAGSGLGAGAAIGGIVALVVLLIILIVELSGSTSALAMMIAGNMWMWTGGIAAVAIIAILAGMFIGKASE